MKYRPVRINAGSFADNPGFSTRIDADNADKNDAINAGLSIYKCSSLYLTIKMDKRFQGCWVHQGKDELRLIYNHSYYA